MLEFTFVSYRILEFETNFKENDYHADIIDSI